MKLGFCFLLKEGLSHCSLWEDFFRGAPFDAYGVYVHAKTSTPSPVLFGSCVDPDPLRTSWGDLSLIAATERLFSRAVGDGCDAMVLLSGDMLPLQSFAWIEKFCAHTRFSIQPRTGLTSRQTIANVERFSLISSYFHLPMNQLCKQNMFFVITRDHFRKVTDEFDIAGFPLRELADEYFWVNHLIRLGVEWSSSRVVFCNSDLTKTQALVMDLTLDLLSYCRLKEYAFIRKIVAIEPVVVEKLREIYSFDRQFMD